MASILVAVRVTATVAAMVKVMGTVGVMDTHTVAKATGTTTSGTTYKMPASSSTTDALRLSNPCFDPLLWYVADAVMHGFGSGNGNGYGNGRGNSYGYGYGFGDAWGHGYGYGDGDRGGDFRNNSYAYAIFKRAPSF
jgi:hypothetical protein